MIKQDIEKFPFFQQVNTARGYKTRLSCGLGKVVGKKNGIICVFSVCYNFLPAIRLRDRDHHRIQNWVNQFFKQKKPRQNRGFFI